MASQPGSSILASGSRPQRHAVSDVKDGGALQAGAGAAITAAAAGAAGVTEPGRYIDPPKADVIYKTKAQKNFLNNLFQAGVANKRFKVGPDVAHDKMVERQCIVSGRRFFSYRRDHCPDCAAIDLSRPGLALDKKPIDVTQLCARHDDVCVAHRLKPDDPKKVKGELACGLRGRLPTVRRLERGAAAGRDVPAVFFVGRSGRPEESREDIRGAARVRVRLGTCAQPKPGRSDASGVGVFCPVGGTEEVGDAVAAGVAASTGGVDGVGTDATDGASASAAASSGKRPREKGKTTKPRKVQRGGGTGRQ